jgi:DNA-binding NarL/FixJ family response regulator
LGVVKTVNLKVLIVEDEMILALDVKYRLEKLGYNVVGIADNGEDAIKLTKERTPDVILMDVVIKGVMDGIDTTKQINKLYDTPIMYTTAYFDDDILKRTKKTKSYGFIIKPYQDGQINTAILTAITKHQQCPIHYSKFGLSKSKN